SGTCSCSRSPPTSWTAQVPRRSGVVRLLPAIAVAVPLFGGCGSPSGLGKARAMVDDGRFGNGPTSGETFSAIASQLLRAARRCRAADAKDDVRCPALFEAAAGAETTGGALLSCTAPAVYDARARWRSYLDRLGTFERHPT